MIDRDKRNVIFQLHQAGMSLREISRRFEVSRNTVRRIIVQQGKFERMSRKNKKQIDSELLARLYREGPERGQRARTDGQNGDSHRLTRRIQYIEHFLDNSSEIRESGKEILSERPEEMGREQSLLQHSWHRAAKSFERVRKKRVRQTPNRTLDCYIELYRNREID